MKIRSVLKHLNSITSPAWLALTVILYIPPASSTSAASWDETVAERRQWWSLQPLRPVQPPANLPADSGNSIDYFIRKRLQDAGLDLAPSADKRTLIRRLSLVLTGMPPEPEDIRQFVESTSPDAWERLVDRLLASPHFGERWARHWLDVVRFSETHGNEWNYEVHHAWRYRDYLIRAFNQDLPYNQFVREHIAGDLLENPRWNHEEQFNESVIGTAFYRFGEVNHDDCIGLPQIGYEIVDNQIDTLTKAFQATTVACARCHDHKLDAISAKDYHGLLGIIRSSRQVSHTIDPPNLNEPILRQLRTLKSQIRQQISELWLTDAADLDRYLLAAQSNLQHSNPPPSELNSQQFDRWLQALRSNLGNDHPLSFWRQLFPTNNTAAAADFISTWKLSASQQAQNSRDALEFNRTNFLSFADFQSIEDPGWHTGGHGLRDGKSPSGEFTVAPEGDAALDAILPAGLFTHTLSQRQNGTLRSPLLTNGISKISFQVMGRRSSALRLVSNNCQLNYKNYRALTNTALQWVTFSPPEDADVLRVYAELMTMLDNPKFPDQLSSLGGDNANYKVPWEKAAENPRSYFGIARAVIHSVDDPPKPDHTHLAPLWAEPAPHSPAQLAERYSSRLMDAVLRWRRNAATEGDVVWLNAFLKSGLLRNQPEASPHLNQLVTEYRKLENSLAIPRIIPGLGDFGPGFDQPLLVRGDCTKPADPVPRSYVEVLGGCFEPNQIQGSGRRQLAEFIAQPSNPLTARVMANRIWKHLFGEGIVRTVDDFGHAGELPTHPELLDYLADQFIRENWSVKRLVRTIALSKTFQASARPSPRATEVDPLNHLLQHYPARRMEAETIRDSILSAAGSLNRSMFGMSISPYRDKDNADRRLFAGPLDGRGRRSVYIKINLMESPKFLSAFNIPGGKVCQGRRDVSNVPAQSLALLNDPFVLQQAGHWATQLVSRNHPSIHDRLNAMFETAFGRLPHDDERQRFIAAASRFAELRAIQPDSWMANPELWKDLAHTLFNSKEFIFIP